MDVTTLQHIVYPASSSTEYKDIQRSDSVDAAKRDIEALLPKQGDDSVTREVQEQVMMDLKDVQRFLYMLIGSELKVESDDNALGTAVNTVA